MLRIGAVLFSWSDYVVIVRPTFPFCSLEGAGVVRYMAGVVSLFVGQVS